MTGNEQSHVLIYAGYQSPVHQHACDAIAMELWSDCSSTHHFDRDEIRTSVWPDVDPFEQERGVALNDMWAQVIPEVFWANPILPPSEVVPEKLGMNAMIAPTLPVGTKHRNIIVTEALPVQEHVKQSIKALPAQEHVKQPIITNNASKKRIHVKGGKASSRGLVTKQLQDWIKGFHEPYIGQEDKQIVADLMGIDVERVTNFCSNYRKRYINDGCTTTSYLQSI